MIRSKLLESLPRVSSRVKSDTRAGILSYARLLHESERLRRAGRSRVVAAKHSLPEHALDLELCLVSPLYARSRELFLSGRGRISAEEMTVERSLSSDYFLHREVKYTPNRPESLKSLDGRGRPISWERLSQLRAENIVVFHEQNHVTSWSLMPPPPRDREGVRRFLNFSEAVVLSLDLALGEELGWKLAAYFYSGGVIYNAGSDFKMSIAAKFCPRTGAPLLGKADRIPYRNYLLRHLYRNYCWLMGEPEGLIHFYLANFERKYPSIPTRSFGDTNVVDSGFASQLNPAWQRLYAGKVPKVLSRKGESPLRLPRHLGDFEPVAQAATVVLEGFGF